MHHLPILSLFSHNPVLPFLKVAIIRVQRLVEAKLLRVEDTLPFVLEVGLDP